MPPAFTLLVVDECHHTHKDTIYNVILSRYLELKLQKVQPLPQVLGLTASPGTGGASKLQGAIDHILKVSSGPWPCLPCFLPLCHHLPALLLWPLWQNPGPFLKQGLASNGFLHFPSTSAVSA